MRMAQLGYRGASRRGVWARAGRALRRDRYLYLILLPVVAYFALFKYVPMYGLVISFMDYSVFRGIGGSEWVGLSNFWSFFQSVYFFRLMRNTLLISVYGLLFTFPIPIALALLFNEMKSGLYKRLAQTISYLPHFISTVVVVSMLTTMLSAQNGIFNNAIAALGGERIRFLQEPGMFRTIYIASDAWQSAGWSSIIYLAAIAGVSPELYEAATIDGAGRLGRALHVTLPSILPTITILLVMNMGNLLSVGYEKILLMYNELTYETADVISTYVYRKGILDNDYGYSTAVGLFNSGVNLLLLFAANMLSRKLGEVSLW
ncbi:MAG: sugar ABC transporter permease [Clostridiales bacterium]|nr:sugar ABC transporter permease [Clostridiales bacterium]